MSEQDSTCAAGDRLWPFESCAPELKNWEAFYVDVRLQDFRREPATYVIFGDGVTQYVGSTKNLRARMSRRLPTVLQMGRSHWDWKVRTEWGDFDTFEMKARYSTKYGDWLMRELRLIKRLKPACNVQHPGAQRPLVFRRGRRAR